MLPATLAHDVKKQLLHYLGATFQMRLPESEQALQRFFNDPVHGLFKGPWVQVRRPFRLAENSGEQFFDLSIPFTPFRHQWQSWQRLTSKRNKPQHTLVTTGTGSGKTECFLFPLLDHCLRQHQTGKREGIKAIVLYPMNALAADQAGRFAEEILTSEQLSYVHNGKRQARIRVGLYTGRMTRKTGKDEGAEPGTYEYVDIIPPKDHKGKPSYTAITHRASMQENPPDILLTNYKMLDYLLLRPKDHNIWAHNMQDPELLQYLVLDELHTYDGAQGADVACLLRRLKERLGMLANHLCVVGTSATIAGGDDERTMDPVARLCDFASTLFEENIGIECVITEDRYRVEEIIAEATARQQFQDKMPAYPTADQLEPLQREDAQTFAQRVAGLMGAPVPPVALDNAWLHRIRHHAEQQAAIEKQDETTRWGLALSEWLRVHPLFYALLEITEQRVVNWDNLVQQLSKRDFAFRAAGTLAERNTVLMAFLALVAQARELRSGRAFPLVPTQVQLWLRELRRLGAVVAHDPVFSWLDSPIPEKKQLPVVHCTECGEVAWVALDDPDQESLIHQHCQGFALRDDVQAIYQGWGFDGRAASSHLAILSQWREGDDPVQENRQTELANLRWYLAPGSLVVRQGEGACPLSGEKTFAVKVTRETKKQENGSTIAIRRCPHCQTEDSLMFMGSRAATVASVAIDEVFGSVLNNDPKLLAFTDSVQDASHRAGFFSSRTYHFTLRTALQHVIDGAGETGLALPEVGDAMVHYWSQPEPGRPGSEKEVMATLMPPDLREYRAYLDYRNNNALLAAPGKLRQEFVTRLNWQATSEFSLMLTHGRTMELHASATLGWDETVIDQTIRHLQDRLPGLSPAYASLDEMALRLWIYGILHRQRERGGLYHPYLDQYAMQGGLWGKYGWRSEPQDYRETYPPRGRFLPKLLVTMPDKHNDHFMSPPRQGSALPWQLVWARRVLALPAVDDASLVDLLTEFLVCANYAGLLHCMHQDGDKHFYAIHHQAARFYADSEKLECSQSGHVLFRPAHEAALWRNAPSLTYQAHQGRYQAAGLNEREKYYRDRYRKGALRRVFAHEHTGMLNTDEREALELSFNSGGNADDPNVLTATSTLEMGIDIGDLSTTMLCSIPPSTASYLQRIGRAGRKTGTALVLSVINQRPHDLFFYARPDELLCGAVEPPGCWLDASAVLVRQYLAFCFDQGVKEGVLQDFPATGKQLIDELIINKAGHIPKLLDWILEHEQDLQNRFLTRFNINIQDDTRARFLLESRLERLRERIENAAAEFQIQRKSLENAQRYLKEQKSKLDIEVEAQDLREIEQEEKILKSRRRKLGEITALEVLTEHGLLPNYAFPERGVRFSGSTYNRHRPKADKEQDKGKAPIELVRAASSAIRELAPGNHFYTHSHKFDIQQLDVGTRAQPLVEQWAICGQCGHMRPANEVNQPESVPACPQCGYDGPFGQMDRGQHKEFLPLQRSQAVSYMEYYESLSADSGEERDNAFYTLATSFDQTIEQPSGAVGDDELPFGIEYRAAMLMREVNAGYADLPADLEFGVDKKVPSTGFEICQDCGIIKPPAGTPKEKLKSYQHRRSCMGHRETLQKKREGKPGEAYKWKNLYLHRELRSEAIRLLLPDVEPEDLITLEAAIYLGLKIRFQGNPAHLLVKPQVIPDHSAGVTRHYLVLMDAVPGGTGFLKALYQDDKKGTGLPAEGMMDVLRLALNALETCECRKLSPEDDTDGCYRCIRTYHMQFKAEDISSVRGIRLLKKLLEAGARRQVKKGLDEVKVTSLFGSVLEKRFIAALQQWVEDRGARASWRSTLISGTEGFEFSVGDGRLWRIELQPMLTIHHGVKEQCQPDFMFRCDDPAVKPLVVFTDGFEFHVNPDKVSSRLPDDLKKRRAILESEQFLVWNISWQDLDEDRSVSSVAFLQDLIADRILPPFAAKRRQSGETCPEVSQACSHPFEQLKAFIQSPDSSGWQALAHQIAGFSLLMLAGRGLGQAAQEMNGLFELWRQGYPLPPLGQESSGDWVWSTRLGLSEDLLVYGYAREMLTNDFTNLRVALRLGDSPEERRAREAYLLRWRQFLAMMNLFQFSRGFLPFVISEIERGTAPEIAVKVVSAFSADWLEVIDNAVSSLGRALKLMAVAGKMLPEAEFYHDGLGDDLFAELAWPETTTPLAILMGDQVGFADKWQAAGWQVVTENEMNTKGDTWLLSLIPGQEK